MNMAKSRFNWSAHADTQQQVAAARLCYVPLAANVSPQ